MAIYQRDQINYGGMLGNAMANRANYLQRRYDRVAQMGQNWGNAIQQSGQAIQNAFNQAAQYQYNKDQLANQQQFQSEQNALNRAQQLNMAREQQRWQAEQNELSRNSTERIAQQKWQESQDEKLSMNKAKDNLSYQLEKAMLAEYEDALGRTQDPIKRAELQGRINASNLKIKDYESRYPEFNPKPLVKEQTGNQGEAPVFSNEFLKEAGQETPDDIMQNEKVKWSGFKEQLKNVKNSKEAATIIEGLKALNANQYFSEAEAQQLATDIEAAQAIYDKKKAGEIRYNEGMKKYKAAKSALERRQIAEEYGLKI